MKNRTRPALLLALVWAIGLWSFPVFAEETTQTIQSSATEITASDSTPVQTTDLAPTPSPMPTIPPAKSGRPADTIIIDIDVADVPNLIPGGAVFGIYTKDKVFLGAQKIDIINTADSHRMTFTVPTYYTGELFYLMPISGLRGVQYYTTMYPTGAYIPLATFAYLPKTPEDTGIGNHFIMTATPQYDRPVNLSINQTPQTMQGRIKIRDNYTIVPLYEFITKLGMPAESIHYDEANGRIQIDHDGKQLIYFLDSKDVLVNGNTMTQAEIATQKIDGQIYIPLRFTAEKFGCTLTAVQVNGAINISIMLPYNETANRFVNSKGISSRTDYMIWISKSDYTVNVFYGSTNNWNCIRTFPCSIGAPSTPTVTGQFEYFSKESRWSYPTYYVGPIMRFYRGYAIHSTLINYDGTTADGRLGMQISHGCVRVHPDSINWLVENVPLYTKIYVTN